MKHSLLPAGVCEREKSGVKEKQMQLVNSALWILQKYECTNSLKRHAFISKLVSSLINL